MESNIIFISKYFLLLLFLQNTGGNKYVTKEELSALITEYIEQGKRRLSEKTNFISYYREQGMLRSSGSFEAKLNDTFLEEGKQLVWFDAHHGSSINDFLPAKACGEEDNIKGGEVTKQGTRSYLKAINAVIREVNHLYIIGPQNEINSGSLSFDRTTTSSSNSNSSISR